MCFEIQFWCQELDKFILGLCDLSGSLGCQLGEKSFEPFGWGLKQDFYLHLIKWHISLTQVYEDDLDRNYHLLLEILIALKESLTAGDGLPTVKDLQASHTILNLVCIDVGDPWKNYPPELFLGWSGKLSAGNPPA